MFITICINNNETFRYLMLFAGVAYYLYKKNKKRREQKQKANIFRGPGRPGHIYKQSYDQYFCEVYPKCVLHMILCKSAQCRAARSTGQDACMGHSQYAMSSSSSWEAGCNESSLLLLLLLQLLLYHRCCRSCLIVGLGLRSATDGHRHRTA